MNGSPEPLLTVTAGGRVLAWSRAAELVFGVQKSDAIGRFALPLLVRAEGIAELQRALREAEASGAGRARVSLRVPDGELFAPLRVMRDNGSFIVFVEGAEARLPASAPASVPVTRELPWTGTTIPSGDPVTRMLAEASRILGDSYEPGVMLRRVAGVVVPRLADWCVADLIEPDGSLARVAFAHADPSAHELAPRVEAAKIARGSVAASARAARELRTVLVEKLTPADAGLDASLAERVGGISAIAVPIVSRLRTLGALTLVSSARAYTAEDAWWAEDLARRCALSVENARLADALQRARQSALDAAERAKRLQALTRALADALTPSEVSAACVEQGRSALGAAGGAVAILSPDRAVFEVIGGAGESHPLLDSRRRLAMHARLPLADAARSGEPVLLENPGAMIAAYGHEMATQAGFDRGAVAVVPLAADGRAVGALGLHFVQERRFTEDEVAFMARLARQCADALERARLYDAERSARAQADVEARRAAFLADASRVLAASFELSSTLSEVSRLIVPSLADWCMVHVQRADGTLRTRAVEHSLPGLAATMSALRDSVPPPAGVVARVVRTGRSELFSRLEGVPLDGGLDEERARLLQVVGATSRLIVPLVAGGRCLGALELAYGNSGRRFSPSQIPLAEELARRIAIAIDHADLYHEAREAVKRKEESLALVDTLLGTAPVGIAFFDPDLKTVRANDALAALTGKPARDLVGRPLADVLAAFPEDAVKAVGDVLARDAPVVDLEVSAPREGGRARHWITSAYPVRGPDRALHGLGLVIVDVTDLRAVEEELTAARRQVAMSEKMSALGTLVSGVAHEIRTPLAYIANNLFVIRNRLERASRGEIASEDLAANLLEYGNATLEGVERINKLVTDLRRFTKLKSGERQVAALDEIVGEAIGLFRATHRGAVELETRLDPVRAFELDRVQIQQIVINLLDNALDATRPGDRVRVETRPAPGGGVILVEDTGGGIAEDVQARMFEPFFTTKPEGTGLGLSIIRRIVELHGGTIRCESRLGKGTTFTIFLPENPRAPA